MAVFSYRTEELKLNSIDELFVETHIDRQIVDELKSEAPTILEGSRGTGKSFLLRVAELELERNYSVQKIVPVYLSFKESSLVHAKNKNRFLHWMMAKLCARLSKELRKRDLLEPANSSMVLETGLGNGNTSTLDQIAKQYQESYKSPEVEIDSSSIPDVDTFIEIVQEICEENDIDRICILFDEAAHVFRLEQQHAFFSLFRDLRSPYISCNAAVYPGITSFGPTFEITHDATLLRLERNVFDSSYLDCMKDILSKQVERQSHSDSQSDANKAIQIQNQMSSNKGSNKSLFDETFSLLAYCSHGNPRHLLKTIGALDSFKKTDVETVIKSYYREEIWKEHTALGEKFSYYKSIVDWGREFIEGTVIPKLRTINENPENRGTVQTSTFFWVSRDIPAESKKALSLLAYVGLVQELDQGVIATRRQLGSRYTVHFGALLSEYSDPIKEVDKIVPHLSKKRMTEFGRGQMSVDQFDVSNGIPEDLMSIDVVKMHLSKPVTVLDLTDWQKNKLIENEYKLVSQILEAGEQELRNKVHMVGEVRARQISNAAKTALLEYLLG